jgi:hypothetical protein
MGVMDVFSKDLLTLPNVAPIDVASYLLFTAITLFLIRGIGMLDVVALQQYVNTNMSTLYNLIESGKYTSNTFVKELMSNTLVD